MIFSAAGLLLAALLPCARAGDEKEAISQCLVQLQAAPAEQQAPIKRKLAEAYLKDQDLSRAIKVFLESLENMQPLVQDPSAIPPEEEKIFAAAFEAYLEHKGESTKEAAQKILQEYLPVLKAHPDYYHLTYLAALAYANLGLFGPFFDLFSLAYAHDPSHYLAEKTKAVLHIKLLEQTYEEEERARQRAAVAAHLQKAVKQFPQDTTLYKMLIAFSDEKTKAQIVEQCLDKIIQADYKIPRHDIAFYIQSAIVQKRNDLVRRFLHKAKEWYPYSRTLMSAQEFLDNNKE